MFSPASLPLYNILHWLFCARLFAHAWARCAKLADQRSGATPTRTRQRLWVATASSRSSVFSPGHNKGADATVAGKEGAGAAWVSQDKQHTQPAPTAAAKRLNSTVMLQRLKREGSG
jgi:hypothetical protein